MGTRDLVTWMQSTHWGFFSLWAPGPGLAVLALSSLVIIQVSAFLGPGNEEIYYCPITTQTPPNSVTLFECPTQGRVFQGGTGVLPTVQLGLTVQQSWLLLEQTSD